jgi:hypothetical protein
MTLSLLLSAWLALAVVLCVVHYLCKREDRQREAAAWEEFRAEMLRAVLRSGRPSLRVIEGGRR